MSTPHADRCSRCAAEPGADAARWLRGRTPLTGDRRLCPACHAALPARLAVRWERDAAAGRRAA